MCIRDREPSLLVLVAITSLVAVSIWVMIALSRPAHADRLLRVDTDDVRAAV